MSLCGFLNHLYTGRGGYVAHGTISVDGGYSERFMAASDVFSLSVDATQNEYISLNTFLSPSKPDGSGGRKVNNLKRLNALYLDIDCYKLGLSKDDVLSRLERFYFGAKIPAPTFVMDSGRGLYLIWSINEDRNALPRWSRVQQFLYESCKDLNADPQALDAARILRVPSSVNQKNGVSVSVLRFNDVSYTLHRIIKDYPVSGVAKRDSKASRYGQATECQRRTAKWISSLTNTPIPDFSSFRETYEYISIHRQKLPSRSSRRDSSRRGERPSLHNMLEGRCDDLFRLFASRRGEDCSREYALFLCRLWAYERTHDRAYAETMMLSLNRSFNVPFSVNYATSRTKSAETIVDRGETYKYSLDKIYAVLRILPEEADGLLFLKKSKMDAEQKKEKNRRYYLEQLQRYGRSTVSEQMFNRRQFLSMLIRRGIPKKKICSILGVSERTYDSDFKHILKSLPFRRTSNLLSGLVSRFSDATLLGAQFFQPPYYKSNAFGVTASPLLRLSYGCLCLISNLKCRYAVFDNGTHILLTVRMLEGRIRMRINLLI